MENQHKHVAHTRCDGGRFELDDHVLHDGWPAQISECLGWNPSNCRHVYEVTNAYGGTCHVLECDLHPDPDFSDAPTPT